MLERWVTGGKPEAVVIGVYIEASEDVVDDAKDEGVEGTEDVEEATEGGNVSLGVIRMSSISLSPCKLDSNVMRNKGTYT